MIADSSGRRREVVPRRKRCIQSSEAAAALALPLAALAAPCLAAAAVQAAGATARTAADTAACPWLNQSLPVQQRVSMLMAQMTLADKINMVTGAGTSEPYVF